MTESVAPIEDQVRAQAQDTDYDNLRAAVAQLLPADAAGVRPAPERNALNVYWQLGGLLNDYLSGRATYGERTMGRLAADLNLLPRTLYRARRVHQRLPADLPATVSWSHCRLLVTVDDDDTRHRLLQRVVAAGWTVRKLQAHLQSMPQAPVVPAALHPGTYRIVTGLDEAGVEGPFFDLGFGLRHPLALADKPGKRTRRLLRDLAPGDAVELSEDEKGRPALHRLWGQVEQRLYVYPVLDLQIVATATVKALLACGFGLQYKIQLRLQAPANRLSRAVLTDALKATSGPLLARTTRSTAASAGGYAVDLYQQDETAATVEHLNAAWAART